MTNAEEVERKLAEIVGMPPPAEPLAHISDTAELTNYLCDERARRIERLTVLAPEARVSSAQRGLTEALALSDLMDAAVKRMFSLACRRAGTDPQTLPIAIVATGGYGRRELSPFSDIDITFIPQRDGDVLVDRVIREMFTQLMDICITRCGLEVGYAYRLMEDCGNLDHQTLCGLLDARLIAGSARLFIQFEDAYWTGFNATDFIFSKLAERRKALEKWGEAVGTVEPQLKEGPGGLRDLQTAVWVVQAQNHLPAARARGERFADVLMQHGSLSEQDAKRLLAAKERLFRVRNTLHAVARAERDQLVITRQEEIATLLGYADEWNEAQGAAGAAPPVERFMADLYRDLALVRRLSHQVVERIENSRLILGIGLDAERRQIVPANESLENDDPTWLLWACELAQRYELRLSEAIEIAAVRLVETSPPQRETEESAQIFTRILSKKEGCYTTLQKMADLGILGWFLPEFGALMDLIPYDPAHDYTVGQHTLFVIRNLEALKSAGGNEEQAEMRRILEELPHPEQLILAALLHDCGKAVPGKPHSIVGEELVEQVCRRLRWPDKATANVRFLVRHHLLMAETSRMRDLNLEETIRDFTRIVDDSDRLNMLYLLTYADTRAVGQGVWTQVKGRFLRDLWRRAMAVLSEEEPIGFDDAALARARRRLMKDLSFENLPESEVAEHIRAMPPNYLLNHDLTQIALHIGFVRQVRQGQPVVDFHDDRDATYTELTVCAFDDPMPGLLAKIARVLYVAELNVHSAQVITRETETDRIAMDTFWVDYRGRQVSAAKRREISSKLLAVLTGAEPPPAPKQRPRFWATGRASLRGLSDTAKSLSIRSIRNDLSDTLTVIETSGPDRLGALAYASEAFSRLGWDIRSARVSTWQGEAVGSFYVAGVRPLTDLEIKQALLAVLPSLPFHGANEKS